MYEDSLAFHIWEVGIFRLEFSLFYLKTLIYLPNLIHPEHQGEVLHLEYVHFIKENVQEAFVPFPFRPVPLPSGPLDPEGPIGGGDWVRIFISAACIPRGTWENL